MKQEEPNKEQLRQVLYLYPVPLTNRKRNIPSLTSDSTRILSIFIWCATKKKELFQLIFVRSPLAFPSKGHVLLLHTRLCSCGISFHTAQPFPRGIGSRAVHQQGPPSSLPFITASFTALNYTLLCLQIPALILLQPWPGSHCAKSSNLNVSASSPCSYSSHPRVSPGQEKLPLPLVCISRAPLPLLACPQGHTLPL